jgi:putative glutamine amidotransferase
MQPMRPRIGLTCRYDAHHLVQAIESPCLLLNADYVDAVFQAGGLPLPLPHGRQPDEVAEILDNLDALMFTGGLDVWPGRFREQPHEQTRPMHARRDYFEFELFQQADARQLPILAICLGCQVVNVARGGTLHQHLYDVGRTCDVYHGKSAGDATHEVVIDATSRLARIIGTTRVRANSSHHQAVDRLGRNLLAVATAPDGIVEAVEDPDHRFLVAVQWHPEDLTNMPEHRALFSALVDAARTTQRQLR